jgi:hypothetical protein
MSFLDVVKQSAWIVLGLAVVGLYLAMTIGSLGAFWELLRSKGSIWEKLGLVGLVLGVVLWFVHDASVWRRMTEGYPPPRCWCALYHGHSPSD